MLFGVALLARLALLPLTNIDIGDATARTWLGWLWADHPFLITHGLWGPLHFYLIGAVMWLWPDPVWAPTALHIAMGSLIPLIMYRLTLELFASSRAALAAGLIFAVYPAAIVVSVGALAETPFMLLLGLGLIYLVRAWRPEGRIADAVLAGLAITFASMIRYEAWMLMPFLAVPLLRRPKRAAIFIAVALLHPIFWMTGNALAYGDPFYAFSTTSSWRSDVMGYQPVVELLPGVGRIIEFIGKTVVGLTLPASILISTGVVRSLLKHRVEAIWLIPPFGLFVLFAYFAYQGDIPMKFGYTTTFGLLLIPFVACSLDWFGIENWSLARCRAGAVVLVASIAVFTVQPLWESWSITRHLAFEATPRGLDDGSARELQRMIERAGLQRTGDALVLEFVGFTVTPKIALETKLHPQSICKTPGQTNVPLTSEELQAFLLANRSGVLVTHSSGKLTAHLKLESQRAGTLAGVPLKLAPVGSIQWNSDSPERQYGAVTVARYVVTDSSRIASSAPLSCTMACPISFCD